MKNFAVFKSILFLVLVSITNIQASNILFFHLSCTASHRITIWPLAERLADSGHNVTYIFPISPQAGYHPKIEEIRPSKLIELVDPLVANFDINIRLNNSVLQWGAEAVNKLPQFCEAFYDSPETQEWLSQPNLKYDLVLLEGSFGQCIYGLVHKFGAKHISFYPMTSPFAFDTFGTVPDTSGIPGLFPGRLYGNSKSFLMRAIDTVVVLLSRIWLSVLLGQFESINREKLQLKDMPSFEEMEQETSLVLQNSHFVEDYALSLPPMFVSYSGLHCTEKSRKERKALPKNMESFVSDAEHGFIYVSFGSAVNVSRMPDALRNEFMSAFGSLPKLKVLWRWEGPLPEKVPENIFLDPWFPQLDVLAHPKIRAFITQAGRPSAQEALCYGVPMIAIPIFAEQDSNAFRLEFIEAALIMDITTLTAKQLKESINQIVYTEKYSTRAKELSALFRDRPIDPLEQAHYWVEYVMKHNTSLLRPLAITQTWWQRRLLDVYAFVLAIIIFTIWSIYLILKCILCRCCGCRAKRNNKKIKTN